ncbi:hypothetical protein COCCADRAFT_112839, partial [Bipolaris zeicola 26-R-13]
HSVHFNTSPIGCTKNAVSLAWLKQIFGHCTKQESRVQYWLLILDSNGFHARIVFSGTVIKNYYTTNSCDNSDYR